MGLRLIPPSTSSLGTAILHQPLNRLLAGLPKVHQPDAPGQHAWTPTWRTADRLRDDYPLRHDERFSWLVTGILTMLAFVIRFPGLANPPKIVFDETFYAKEAWSVLHLGYASSWPTTADTLLSQGQTPTWLAQGDAVVHPQMAKYLIALGEWMFGFNSFGWRFMSLICGCLLVAATVRMARRLSRSTLIGALAGFLLCVDGLDYAMSRIALLDIFQAMFTVLAVAAVITDRDWFRNRLARYLDDKHLPNLGGQFGPMIWWRPWRLTAGVLFGLACGCKWNSVYVLAIMGLVSVILDWRTRRTAGARQQAWKSIYKDGILAFVLLAVVGVIVYVGTWAGWLSTSGGYNRNWGADNPNALSVKILGKALASLWNYHSWIWNQSTGYLATLDTRHPYDANPAGWLVIARTIGIEYTGGIPPGTPGCPADALSNCVQTWTTGSGTTAKTTTWVQLPGTPGCSAGTKGTCMTIITGLGTPLLWWMAAIALVAGLIFWIFGRDWRFSIPVLAMAATWLTWFLFTGRSEFFFYSIMIIPFTATILAMCFGKILGPPGQHKRRRGAWIVGICVALIVLNFAFILPILNDTVMPTWAWQLRMWLRGWI
ncbi:MAG: phospholipid carrier-dependent glycosyltransferase [Propionibacteriaceae bacterium]|nr:phospholipid carrier-dependent glycosyltransferase [Propionibacteriaceae bacterium]